MSPPAVVEPGSGTAIVLGHLIRPYQPVPSAAALLGLRHSAAAQLVGAVVATCDEADRLLAAMPQILRSLAIATTDQPERCHGELRGPVLWSETMSARSTSVGDPGLFVCATTTKAYDTAENRILKAALTAIERGGNAATHGRELGADEVLRHARHNQHRARHLLEHQTLSTVPVAHITSRMVRRTMAGSRRATYRPAVSMLARAHDPLRSEHLQAHTNPATIADHDLLAAALLAADAGTDAPLPLINRDGGLTAGAVRYDHLGGVTIGGTVVRSTDEIAPALDRAAAGQRAD